MHKKEFIPISVEHKFFLDQYINEVLNSVKLCSNDIKYNDFIYVYNIIIDYHNQYKESGIADGHIYDLINIIPMNLSSAVQGFLSGVKNQRNKTKVEFHQEIVSKLGVDLYKKLETIKIYVE
jgi:hypothetical protein